MPEVPEPMPLAWIFRMAWRDSRRSRARLLLAAGCMMIGIAGLVATASFRKNVETTLNDQARTLLGADLVVHSRQPFTESTTAALRALGGQQSQQTSFTSMARFPQTGGTRLVRVRALKGDFPYYGELKTDPPEASKNFRSGASALVDDALMIQFDARIGDPVKLGHATFRIVGRLKKIPGETAVQSFVGPRIYITEALLPETGLIQPGSLVSRHRFFRFGDSVDSAALKRELERTIEQPGIRIETVANRNDTLGDILNQVTGFLDLIGFIAILLGGMAVASAMHVYIKQKVTTVGLLRCLGARENPIFAIYLLQATVMALLSALFGSMLGILLQHFLPALLTDFLPVEVNVTLNGNAILTGASVGLATALLFASFPLLSIRSVAPLQVLYRSNAMGRASWCAVSLMTCSVVLVIALFAAAHTSTWEQAAGFTGGLLAALFTLGIVAQCLTAVLRKFAQSRARYVWRQGLANLHRPNNQTPVLLVSIGLASFLIATVYLAQQTLLMEVATTEQESKGNFVLFDVQTDQAGPLKDLLHTLGLEAKHEAPIVSMRLSALNGEPVHAMREDRDKAAEDWALRHEYRATYRDRLIDTETLAQGRWSSEIGKSIEPVPVSLEENIARALNTRIGDELVFDVQGIPITTRVGSIRKVAWRRLQPNFFVLFPPGILEEAPQTHALVTRVDSADQSARLQRAVVSQFPNISMIDLRFMLGAVTGLLDRIALVIRFVGSFSVVTGLVVLLGAIAASRYHRFHENLLLRTLGASRSQVLKITAIEYFLLGTIATVSGLMLSLLSTWGVSYYLFGLELAVAWPNLIAMLTLVVALTVAAGLLGSWGTLNQSPLKLLREE